LLLLLFGHAFLVSATHCHRSAWSAKGQSGVVLGVREDATGLTETGVHAQCLLCRLQRNFVADYHKVSTPLDAPRQVLSLGELPPPLSPVARPFSVPSGRAPPSC
jgi:hypothetical protein